MSTMSQTGSSRFERGGSATKTKDSKDVEYPSLENRTVEYKTDTGVIKKVPAFDKRWAPHANTKWIDFYLPDAELLEDAADASIMMTWSQYMEMLIDDLKWLLERPHYQFWSIMVHARGISQEVLTSFIQNAPRFYDANYNYYESHEVIWPIYKEIYVLVYRVYMRLATYKESKEDHITPSYWSNLLQTNELITMPTLLSLCTLYESKENPVFQKMVENVMKNNSKFTEEIHQWIPVLVGKFEDLSNTMESLITENLMTHEWDHLRFDELLWFQLDTVYSIYKLLKVYPDVSGVFLHHPNFVNSMAALYETNTKRWGKVVSFIRNMEERANLCRAGMLRLFRAVLATPTILSVESANDKRLDQFFDYFSSCIDEKVFIHDYEKAFPFRSDMQSLLSRGIFVDDTRIDYMANAISSCFHACGEEYSVEKLVVDPLYDPNFDRQLLGACSLEITGVELDSLITQVKDLLPELPSSYVEAVLKHYGYTAETTINALLEGSVPTRLEKYKSEDYVRSQSSQTEKSELEDQVQDKLPVHFQADGVSVTTENGDGSYSVDEKFYAGKRSHGFKEQTKFLEADKHELKSQILQRVAQSETESITQGIKSMLAKERSKNGIDDHDKNSYIDESLLPSFHDVDQYDDEYDDTYDDVGAGMTEPDNMLFNPLNRRKAEYGDPKESSPEDQEEDGPSGDQKKDFDTFCEDPAVVRARFERRRAELQSRRGGGGGGYHQPAQQHNAPRDVVGRAKGQGQEKDVVYNRRQKTQNKGAGGSWKKKSDFKRKEF